MIREAIADLKDRHGSSTVAIKRSITTSNPDLNFAQHLLRKALKKGVEKELLIKARLFAHSESHMFNHSRPYIYQASTNGWTCVSPHTWRWPTISGGGGLHVCTMHACMGLRGTRFD